MKNRFQLLGANSTPQDTTVPRTNRTMPSHDDDDDDDDDDVLVHLKKMIHFELLLNTNTFPTGEYGRIAMYTTVSYVVINQSGNRTEARDRSRRWQRNKTRASNRV